ncbi:MAG: hypothetical protein KC414_14645, partial [Romboutsia sp.]|nr:hypothetical protein [Romboutsia sp.]
MKRLFFSCILIYYCFVLFAQTDPFYINYTAKDGLPTDNIYSVFYNKGIIWFTTGLGVVKYNGKDFQTYNTSDGLSSNEVIKMHKDSKGRIWLLTLNGKPSLLINNTFYSYKNSKLLQQINGTGYILDFTEDDNQSISLSYRNGEVFEIDKDNIVRHWNSNLQSAWGIWNEDQQYFVISEGLIYEYPQKRYHKTSGIKVPIRTFKHNKQIYVTGKNSIYIADKYNLKLLYTLQEDVEIT